MQDFYVARIFFEQSTQRENADLRPARRHRRFFQNQVRLAMVRFFFQNFLDHLHRALRILFHFPLRFHHGQRRGRDIKDGSLGRFAFGHFGSAQQLPARSGIPVPV